MVGHMRGSKYTPEWIPGVGTVTVSLEKERKPILGERRAASQHALLTAIMYIFSKM